MRSEAAEQWPNLVLGPQIRLSVVLLGHLKAHLHPFEQLIISLLGTSLVQARELILPLLVELHTLRDIEGVRPEKSIDLLLKLGHVLLVEGGLEHLR